MGARRAIDRSVRGKAQPAPSKAPAPAPAQAPHRILGLQRSAGNLAVAQLLARTPGPVVVQRLPDPKAAPPIRKAAPTAEQRLAAVEQELRDVKGKQSATDALLEFQNMVLARATGWELAAKKVGSAYKTAANRYQGAISDDAKDEQVELTLFASVLTVFTVGGLAWLGATLQAGEPLLEAGAKKAAMGGLEGRFDLSDVTPTAPHPGAPARPGAPPLPGLPPHAPLPEPTPRVTPSAGHGFDVSDVHSGNVAGPGRSASSGGFDVSDVSSPGRGNVPVPGSRPASSRDFDVSDVRTGVSSTPKTPAPADAHAGRPAGSSAAGTAANSATQTAIGEGLDLFPGAAGRTAGPTGGGPIAEEALDPSGRCWLPGAVPAQGSIDLGALFAQYQERKAAEAASRPIVFAPGGVSADPQNYQNSVEQKVGRAKKGAYEYFTTLSQNLGKAPANGWAAFDPTAQRSAHAEWLAKAGLLASDADLPSEDTIADEFERSMWAEHYKRQTARAVSAGLTTVYPKIGDKTEERLKALGIAKDAGLKLTGIEWFENGHLFEDYNDDDARAVMGWARGYKSKGFGP